jgi:molybdopterin synthase catalytic subunit/molybdopterin synthase sulfur carrier subunit
MRVRVLAFARLRELLGFGERDLELAPQATLADAWAAITADVPDAARLSSSTRLARNGVLGDGSVVLGEGDEIALLPPVGGG